MTGGEGDILVKGMRSKMAFMFCQSSLKLVDIFLLEYFTSLE